ncbi:unannotated protein [freshwater metagenome]|uniref:Unannotated protein n=1 Tax=freshwater metagenome TaxID=449393 RepID=A0A6J7J4W1_9ZZZZ
MTFVPTGTGLAEAVLTTARSVWLVGPFVAVPVLFAGSPSPPPATVAVFAMVVGASEAMFVVREMTG